MDPPVAWRPGLVSTRTAVTAIVDDALGAQWPRRFPSSGGAFSSLRRRRPSSPHVGGLAGGPRILLASPSGGGVDRFTNRDDRGLGCVAIDDADRADRIAHAF